MHHLQLLLQHQEQVLVFAFSISTGVVKNLLKTTQNKQKKNDKTVILAKSKLNSIERKISEALINNEINHENFTAIIDEEKNLKKS